MMANLHPYITVWMKATMRLPNTARTSQPWRIHELTCDFRLEDMWVLPTPGAPDDFPRLVQGLRGRESDTAFAHRAVGPVVNTRESA